jgi:cytochrome o ubiquinol oxidase subunit 1
MGFLFGLMNLNRAIQIGARDLASPFLNTLGFWFYMAGAILINLFFVFGAEFAATGWLAQAPLSELQFSPGVGVDYWIWSLQISGLGTLLGGINFLADDFKKARTRHDAHENADVYLDITLQHISYRGSVSNFAMTINLLFLDRFLGMHFFTTDFGGNPMMYTNLIWSWGHPEVYILVLPAFGVFSEIVSTFSGKKVYGYVSMVASAIGITLLSLLFGFTTFSPWVPAQM